MNRKIVAFYNRKGGIGSTSSAAHLCWLARQNGIPVAGMSLDPRVELRSWLAPLGIPWFDALRDEEPTDDVQLVVADIHSHIDAVPFDPDLWVMQFDNRTAYENAIALSDELSGPILWLPNHINGSPTFLRYEVPSFLTRVEPLFPGVPRSHTIAEAGAKQQVVWHTEDGARSPGGILLRRVMESVLRRAGFEPAARGPAPFTAHPVEDNAAVHHAHAIAAALLEQELQHWPSPRITALADEGLLDGERDGADPGRDLAIKHALRGLADALWDRAGAPPRGRR